jgi:hypothetical protein
MKVWARIAVWALLESGVFGAAGTGDELLQQKCLAMRASLMAFYKRRHAAYPDEHLTRVADFYPKLVGTASSPVLKTKGAETYGLMLYLIEAIRMYGSRVSEHERLLQAGEALATMVSIWRSHGWVLPADAQEVVCKV